MPRQAPAAALGRVLRGLSLVGHRSDTEYAAYAALWPSIRKLLSFCDFLVVAPGIALAR